MYAFLDAVRYLVRRLLPFIGIYFFAELTELSILACGNPPTCICR